MKKYSDGKENFGFAITVIFAIAFLVISYAVVHFFEVCEIEPGFSGILDALKRFFSTGSCNV